MILTDLPSKNATSEAVNIHTTSSIDINDGDYDGRTILHLAVAARREQALVLLTSKGVNANVVDNWDVTPLDNAVRTIKDNCMCII